jgi:hypothetical protein
MNERIVGWRSLRTTWLVLLAWLSLGTPARAQVGSAVLTGTVTDQGGGAVPGAAVSATGTGYGRVRVATSDAAGNYVIPGLAPGAYDVRFELSGFRTLSRRGIVVATGDTVRLDVVLSVGSLAEALTVVGDVSQLRSATSGLGQVIDNQKIATLPLNGRSFIALAGLAAGVALPPGSLLPRINGGRPRTNEYLYDGISVLQPEPGQVAFFPNLDAIQEFKIESNSPPAEFGRFNGGVVNLTTKSGTNTVRGTGFKFLRHESLNSRNFFASNDLGKPKYRRHQIGGVLGGPIQKDRTFFFADYQRQRQTIGRALISTVPTRLQRDGIFTEPIAGRVPGVYDPATTEGTTRTPFAGNTIPVNRIDPVALALLGRYPLPTSGGTANNFQRLDDERADQDQVSIRLDRQFGGNRDHLFGRLTRVTERFTPVTPLPDGSGAAGSTSGPQDTTAWSFASHHQRAFSSTLFNEVRSGETRRHVNRTAAQLRAPASVSLGIPGIPSTSQFANTLPSFVIAGYQQIGSPPNTASDFSTGVTEIADTLTWLSGRHTVKLGGDARWERLDVVQPPSPTGSFTFSALFTDLPGTPDTGSPLASFLLGQVQQFSIDLQQGAIRNRAHFQEYFVQDDWTATDRLTINAGVRYTLNFPSTEAHDQAAVFNLATRQLDFLGHDGEPRSARQLHRLNFGPRLGVAHRLGDRAVARAAYGLVWIEQAGITSPFTTPAFPYLQSVTQRTLDNLMPAFTLANGPSVTPIPLTPDAGLGQGVFAVDRDLGSGYVQQWNVSVQHDVSRNLTGEVAYVGSTIVHVGIPDSNLNQLTVDQLALGPALLQRVANPFFGTIPRSSSLGDPTIPVAQLLKPYPAYTTVSLYRNNVGTTRYHGFSAKLQQRLSHGLSYLVSYTRSKLVDDASSVFDASVLTGPIANFAVADSFNRRLERDYSTGDIPHVLAASTTWDLPVGAGRQFAGPAALRPFASDWSLSAILTLQSGVPVAVTQSTNNNAFAGFGIQRPNVAGDPTLDSQERTINRWFNTAAFSTAPQFSVGTASRNTVRGPGYRNLDIALVRHVPLPRRRALDLRIEAFNVANRPPLGAPNGVFGSAAFGTITSAGDPRVLQLAMKFLL